MAKEENNERELTWEELLLGSLLFPYLLTANYEKAYEERLEELKKEKEGEDKVEKSFGNVEQKESDKEGFSVQKVVEACAKQNENDVPSDTDPKEEDVQENDLFVDEFRDVNADDFVANVVANNKHTEYYSLSKFVRDALVDLESGTEELSWEYNPDDLCARLKLNDFVPVDDKTATLFNYESEYVYVDVKIKKELNKENKEEYYLVVEL